MRFVLILVLILTLIGIWGYMVYYGTLPISHEHNSSIEKTKDEFVKHFSFKEVLCYKRPHWDYLYCLASTQAEKSKVVQFNCYQTTCKDINQ